MGSLGILESLLTTAGSAALIVSLAGGGTGGFLKGPFLAGVLPPVEPLEEEPDPPDELLLLMLELTSGRLFIVFGVSAWMGGVKSSWSS